MKSYLKLALVCSWLVVGWLPGCGGAASCKAGEKVCVTDRSIKTCENGAWTAQKDCPAEEMCMDGQDGQGFRCMLHK